MTSILELNDLEAIERYRDEWQQLWEETPGRSVAQSVDWFLAWCRHAAPGCRPRVMLARAGGEPVGLLPLMESTGETATCGARTLRYGVEGWSVFCGPLGKNPTATLVLAMQCLREQPRRQDVISLSPLDADGADHGRTFNAFRVCGMPAVREDAGRVPLIETSGDLARSESGLLRERFDDLDRAERVLARQGRVGFQRLRPDPSTSARLLTGEPLLESCHRLRELSAGGLAGPLARSPVTCGRKLSMKFLRESHMTAVEAGGADLCLLSLDGEPVAAIYSHQAEGRVEGIYHGQHPLAPAEAMLVLFGRMVRDSFDRQDRWIVPPAGIAVPWAGWVTRTVTQGSVRQERAAMWRNGLRQLGRLLRAPARSTVPLPVREMAAVETPAAERLRAGAVATGRGEAAEESVPRLKIAEFSR